MTTSTSGSGSGSGSGSAVRVTKRDGSLEPYDGYEVARPIEAARARTTR